MLVVVGGHSRNTGKTAAITGLIRRLRDRDWTALKITQHAHALCVRDGSPCECGPEANHACALTEEYEPGQTDTGRYLAAGAKRSFWLRTLGGRLFESVDIVRRIADEGTHTIVESTSLVEFFDPDLYLMMLDYACEDFKDSSRRTLDRVDAFLVVDRGLAHPVWKDLPAGEWQEKPRFPVKPPAYVTAAVAEFVSSRDPAAPER